MTTLATETWRPVLGYEGWYSVSDLGRVRRERGGHGSRIGHILTPAIKQGYPFVILCTNYAKRNRYVHQLVAEAFIGPRPDGQEVNHKNGVRTDSRPGNLEYVTATQNQHHKADVLGTLPRGASSHQSKLTEQQVVEIRAAATSGESRAELAKRFGVSRAAIRFIVLRKNWKHVA